MITVDDFHMSILPYTLRFEGGYVNDQNDKGGETYRGISRKANPDWEGWQLLKRHLPLVRNDIVNDTQLNAAVAKLYYQKYFDFLQDVDSHLVALFLFDFRVHGGFTRAKLQQLLNDEFGCDLKVDGVIGPKSLAAINAQDSRRLASAILNWRQRHLNGIVERDQSQAKFMKGWQRRIDCLRAMIKKNV